MSTVFWNITPCSLIETALLAACFFVVGYLAYFSTLKLKVVLFPEVSVNFYQTAGAHIAEDSNIRSGRHENLRPSNS
jgi:hypothetical protein